MVAKRSYILALGSLAVGTCVVFLASQGCAKKPAVSVVSTPPAAAGSPAPAARTSQADKVQAPGPSGAAPATGQNVVAPATGAAAKPAPPSAFTTVSQLEDIHFAFDRYEIRPGDAQVLGVTARWLKTNPTVLLLIEGHCDERGTGEYNMALGERRAQAAMKFLVAQGIEARRISTVSYGKERPQCADKNDRCWSANRRAHFLVKLS